MFKKFNQLTYLQEIFTSKIIFVVFLGLVISKSLTVVNLNHESYHFVKKNDFSVIQSLQLVKISSNIKTTPKQLPSEIIKTQVAKPSNQTSNFIHQLIEDICQKAFALKKNTNRTKHLFNSVDKIENETKQFNI
jgi:hypothetical protein